MNREKIGASIDGSFYGFIHSIWNVIKLEIQEHVMPFFLKLSNKLWTGERIKLETYFKPSNASRCQFFNKRTGFVWQTVVEGNDELRFKLWHNFSKINNCGRK